MFKFSDNDIDSKFCSAYDLLDKNQETEKGFILCVNDKEILLTQSEIDYMMTEINKL